MTPAAAARGPDLLSPPVDGMPSAAAAGLSPDRAARGMVTEE